MSEILKEMKRLHMLGFGVHWIKPHSKAPVKAGWSAPERDDIKTLVREYKAGYGLGVKMGAASKLSSGGYLANIDVDIKSGRPEHTTEAMDFVESQFGKLDCPVIKTGYGYRFLVRTKTPTASGKLGSSAEEVKAMMPTSEINNRQLQGVAEGKITKDELQKGFRLRPAWEVEFMSIGKQVVLPPSIHPDTGNPYKWLNPFRSESEIPLVDAAVGRKKAGRPAGSTSVYKFTPVPVDLMCSSLSDRIIEMIQEGKDVSDRSAACFTVTLAMLRARFTEDEILTVLTDKSTVLGETAYEHRNTSSRAAAAAWIRDYCIVKAKAEVSAEVAFGSAVEVTPLLSDDEADEQMRELEGDWQSQIKRSGKDGLGPPKPTVQNVVLILENAVAKDVFKRNTFALRDFNGVATPWGGEKGAALSDDDVPGIKMWLAENFRFEPPTAVIWDAMAIVSMRNSFHPVREELEKLPEWDGTKRLDTWLKKYFGAHGPDEYLAQVFRKWMVASVARTFVPGTKFDWIILLEGLQGTGKSSFGSILFGEDYFTDWLPSLADKDAALSLQGIRCVEFGELDQLRRNEMETTKAFITRRVDKVRPPYGRRTLESKRQCVFFGTTNKGEYLKDESGNRRFNPVEVGHLNFKQLAKDRNQLWAEALYIYEMGLEESLYLEKDAEQFAKEIQSDKMVASEKEFMVHEMEEFIQKELIKPPKEQFNFTSFRLIPLFNTGGPFNKFPENGRSLQFAAQALKLIGAKTYKSNGKNKWTFPHHVIKEGMFKTPD